MISLCFVFLIIFNNCQSHNDSGGEAAPGPGAANTPSANNGELRSTENLLIAGDDGGLLGQAWAIANDPTLFKMNNSWNIIFSSMDFNKPVKVGNKINYYKCHLTRMSLPPGAPVDSPRSSWVIDSQKAISPTEPPTVLPPAGDWAHWPWDSECVEMGSYVEGVDPVTQQTVKRIYYVGWTTGGYNDLNYKAMRIGFAQWNGSTWVKYAQNPVVLPDNPSWQTLIGSPDVFYDSNSKNWYMYFSTADWDSATQVSRTHLGLTVSTDGIHWGPHQKMDGKWPYPTDKFVGSPLHTDMIKISRPDGKNYALYGWVPYQRSTGGVLPDLALQGLWITYSATPDCSGASDCKEWQPLVYENNGNSYHDSGPNGSYCHQTGFYGRSEIVNENGRPILFYNGHIQKSGDSCNKTADMTYLLFTTLVNPPWSF